MNKPKCKHLVDIHWNKFEYFVHFSAAEADLHWSAALLRF